MKQCLLLSLLFFICSCNSDDSLSQSGGNSGLRRGSSYDVLVHRGDCKLFAEAVEIAGFSDLLRGKGLSTIMVPSDQVFKKYLDDNGYGSLKQIDIKKLKEIVGVHFLMNSFNKEQLIDFQPRPTAPTLPGLSYKQRTYFARGIEEIAHPNIPGKMIKVYHREKHLSLFSSMYWKSVGVSDPKANYEFFCPDVQWEGNDNCVNGPGFGISEYAIPTDNGYIYMIDHVIDGLPTIYQKMEESRFGITKKLIDKFASPKYDASYTLKFATVGDSLFNYLHIDQSVARLQNVAFEWPVISTALYSQHSSDGITAFVPNDDAMKAFFNEFFSGYGSYDELPDITKYFLLENHQTSPTLLWPEMLQDKYATIWGDLYHIDLADIGERRICSNGLFYELRKVIPPWIFFRSALSRLFSHKGYELFAGVTFRSGLMANIANKESEQTLFIVNDDNMKKAGYSFNNVPFYDKNPIRFKSENFTIANAARLVNYHSLPLIISELPAKAKWYETNIPLRFVKIDGDTVLSEAHISQSTEEEKQDNPALFITEMCDQRYDNRSRSIVVDGTLNPDGTNFGSKCNQIYGESLKEFNDKIIKANKSTNKDFVHVNSAGRIIEFLNMDRGVLFILRPPIQFGKNGIPAGNKPALIYEYAKRYMVHPLDNPMMKMEDLLNASASVQRLQTRQKGYTLTTGVSAEGNLTVTPSTPGAKPIEVTGTFFCADAICFIVDTPL